MYQLFLDKPDTLKTYQIVSDAKRLWTTRRVKQVDAIDSHKSPCDPRHPDAQAWGAAGALEASCGIRTSLMNVAFDVIVDIVSDVTPFSSTPFSSREALDFYDDHDILAVEHWDAALDRLKAHLKALTDSTRQDNENA